MLNEAAKSHYLLTLVRKNWAILALTLCRNATAARIQDLLNMMQ
jgi:hypothetical protein